MVILNLSIFLKLNNEKAERLIFLVSSMHKDVQPIEIKLFSCNSSDYELKTGNPDAFFSQNNFC